MLVVKPFTSPHQTPISMLCFVPLRLGTCKSHFSPRVGFLLGSVDWGQQKKITRLGRERPPLLMFLLFLWVSTVGTNLQMSMLGRKVMTNLDSIFKSRNITLPTKVRLVKAMVFPVVMYGCESWSVKKADC